MQTLRAALCSQALCSVVTSCSVQYTRLCWYSDNPHISNVMEWQTSRKGQTCWHYTGIYSPICTCSCTKCILIIADIKRDKWKYTIFIEVWCKVNGHIKKFKRRILALFCILERKRSILKELLTGEKRNVGFLGTYTNFMNSAVGVVIRMCFKIFQIPQRVKQTLPICLPFL